MFRKIDERDQIERFLDAYSEIDLPGLELICHRDRPDFLCRRSNGLEIGVEVTIVTRSPEHSFAEDALNGVRFMEGDAASWMLFGQIQTKERLRQSEGWYLPDNCILLLSTPDCSLSEISSSLIPEDFQDNGFIEIWIADFTEVEAYGEVELFCLKPFEHWGRYRRDRGKPYG